MRAVRRPWLFASFLLLLGALAAAGAVRQHWLPCRGSMLRDSVIEGYANSPDYSRACLNAMDSGFGLLDAAPDGRWSAELGLGTLAVILLALSWRTVVAGSDWSRSTKQRAMLPAVATAVTLVLNVSVIADLLGPLSVLLLLAPNVLAVVALVAIIAQERPRVAEMLQIGLALAASTAAGFIPTIAEYSVMVHFSDADWDAPPGSGYPTVATVVLLALILLAITLRRSPGRPTTRVMTAAGA